MLFYLNLGLGETLAQYKALKTAAAPCPAERLLPVPQQQHLVTLLTTPRTQQGAEALTKV